MNPQGSGRLNAARAPAMPRPMLRGRSRYIRWHIPPAVANWQKNARGACSVFLAPISAIIGNGAWASTPSTSPPSAKRSSSHVIVLRTATKPRGRGSTVVPPPETLGWPTPSAGKSTDAKAQAHGYARAAPTRERRASRLARTTIARRARRPRPGCDPGQNGTGLFLPNRHRHNPQKKPRQLDGAQLRKTKFTDPDLSEGDDQTSIVGRPISGSHPNVGTVRDTMKKPRHFPGDGAAPRFSSRLSSHSSLGRGHPNETPARNDLPQTCELIAAR
jgi:hypothetical protein